MRERFWLETFAEAAAEKRSLIFTFAPENTVTPDFLARAISAVEDAGGTVRFVQLKISDDEQERRVSNADRAQFGKLASQEALRELRPMFKAAEAAMPAPDIVIDTDTTAPERAAQAIARALA